MAKTVYLNTPISEDDIRALELDDIVYITGDAYTMLYPDHYTYIMELIDHGESLPMDLNGGVIYNTGTIYRKNSDDSYDYRALGATTSSKYNAYTPKFIKMTGVRTVIGKGGMDEATLDSMKVNGCVYLAIVGGCSAVYTPLAKLVADYWPERTQLDNQRLKLEMNEFGPLVVAMDAHGNSIFQQCAKSTKDNSFKIYQKLGIDRE